MKRVLPKGARRSKVRAFPVSFLGSRGIATYALGSKRGKSAVCGFRPLDCRGYAATSLLSPACE